MSLRSFVARRWLARYASGDLGARATHFVAAAIAADAALAHDYNALRRVEAAAAATNALTAGQIDLIEQLVLASAARPAARSTRRPIIVTLGGAVTASACVAALLLVSNGAKDGAKNDDESAFAVGELAARGEHMSRDSLGVRVSCVVDGVVRDDATAGVRRRTDVLECPADAQLAFATTNMSAELRFVFIVGIAPDGELRWYSPFRRASDAIALKAGAQHEVLPETADTRGMPLDDHVSLHVLFSDRPFHGREVERQLEAALKRGIPLGTIERLPVAGVPVQARIDVRRP